MEPKWLAFNVSQQMAATSGIAIWHKGKKANENGIKMACIQCHKTNGSNIWYCHLPSRLVRKWQWNLNGLQPISQTNGVNIWHCRLPSSLVRKLNPNDLHPMPQNKWQQLLALPYTIEDSKQTTMEPKWIASSRKTNGSNFWHFHMPSRLVRKWQWNLNGLEPMSQNKWRQHLGFQFAIQFS